MKKILYLNLFLFILLVFLFVCQPAMAGGSLTDALGIAGEVAGDAGYTREANNVNTLIGTIIKTALSLLGVVFLVLMIYGGFLWMTDRGNEEQLKRAKNLISAAIIGLIIVVAAYAISYFVIEKITSGMLESSSSAPPTTPPS